MAKRAALVWSLGATLAVSGGCGRAPQEFGTRPATVNTASITQLLTDRRLEGQTVEVTGRVTRVCQHVGCWFYVSEGGRELYVDLQGGRHFVVPRNSAGRMATVAGVVRREAGEPRLVARWVRLR
jgi:hypothetical protein